MIQQRLELPHCDDCEVLRRSTMRAAGFFWAVLRSRILRHMRPKGMVCLRMVAGVVVVVVVVRCLRAEGLVLVEAAIAANEGGCCLAEEEEKEEVGPLADGLVVVGTATVMQSFTPREG